MGRLSRKPGDELMEEHVEKHGRAFLLKMIGEKTEVSSQAFMWGKTSSRV